jgi:hypothetical protein
MMIEYKKVTVQSTLSVPFKVEIQLLCPSVEQSMAMYVMMMKHQDRQTSSNTTGMTFIQ